MTARLFKMDDQNLDCYDVFNDYLGLSSFVGGQEDPYFLVRSLLAKGPRPEGDLLLPISSHLKESPDSAGGSQAFGSPEPNVSDVERLFGRGATLHKTSPTNVTTTGGVLRCARLSPVLNLPSNANHQAASTSGQALVGLGSQTNQYEQAPSGISSGNIDLELNAILQKYNRMYNHQKATHSIAHYTENNSSEWSSAIASLAAAIAKVEASRDGPLKGPSPPQCASACYQGTTSAFPSSEMPGASQNTVRFVGCSFCKNNKEVKEWFMSHQLKNNFGRVTCPVLRSYICPLCDATGDNAHTVGHCPLNPDRRNSLPLAIRSKANATGKRKYL